MATVGAGNVRKNAKKNSNKVTSQGKSMNTRFRSKNDKRTKKKYRGQGK